MPGVSSVTGIAFRALLIWCAILLLAMVNGTLREALLLPAFGAPAALLLSGALLCLCILLVTYLTLPWLRLQGGRQCAAVGAGWLLLTLVFEFSFGLWQGKSWPELLAPYRFSQGNVWPLVLVVVAVAPWLAVRWRQRGPRPD